MIPFSSWVKGLIASCAKTHETNNFTQPQNIKNGVTIDSDSLTDGYKGYVKFTNNGDVSGVYGHVSATGTKSAILKAGNKKLGVGITDEGFSWTYSEHPVEDGDPHQIATYGYVQDNLDSLDSEFDSFNSRLTQAESRITVLETQLANLDLSTDATVTINGTKPVKGSGIYTFVMGQIDEIIRNLNDAIKEALESNIITSINFGTPKEKSVSGDTYTFTPEEPGIMLIKFYRKGGKACRWYKNDNLIAEAGGGDGTVIQSYPLRSGIKYKWECDGGVSQAVWIPLTFQVGE